MIRYFLYRVYFTNWPKTYHVVNGHNYQNAIRRAKRLAKALCLTQRSRRKPLTVWKVERLYPGNCRVLKTA